MNIVFDTFQPDFEGGLNGMEFIWDGFFDTVHPFVMSLCNEKAYNASDKQKYNELIAEQMESSVAWKTIFMEAVKYNYLSVGVMALFVKPVSQCCMEDMLPYVRQTMTPIHNFAQPTMEVVYPLWCHECKHTSGR